MWKFLDWAENNEWRIFFISLIILVLTALLLRFIPELKDIAFVGYTIVLVVFFLALLVCGGHLGGKFSELLMLGIISSSERAKQKAESKFNEEQEQIVDQILTEKDNEKKQDLEQQALALRQEYESLMSENLRKTDGTFVADWREVLLVGRKRLADEEQRLLARNRVNLRNGILMAFIGVALPASYIFWGNKTGEADGIWTFIINYLPALSVVLILEIVAIFFLRLYALTEHRIERNKNEITNIELRLTAGLMLPSATGQADFESLSNHLAKEERNFVLGKNESSAGIGVDRVAEILSKVIKGGVS